MKTISLTSLLVLVVAAAATAQTPPTDSACAPSAAALRTLAMDLYAKQPDATKFLEALDAAVGVNPKAKFLDRVVVMASGPITIAVFFPYNSYRGGLETALRKREPLDAVPVPTTVRVGVSPSRINAPDIEKIIVERAGEVIDPLSTTLQPRELTTTLGAKAMLHAGEVAYPCAAFAPGGASVKITAIPRVGENIVAILKPDLLAKLK